MSKRRAVTVVGVVALAAVLLPGRVAAAPETEAQRQAARLTHALMSPFCPGKLLAECTSPDAGVLRQAILHRLEAGEGPDAVQADLVRRYGTSILGAPALDGVGWLVWLTPALLGVGTAAGLGWKVARAERAGRAGRNATVVAPAGIVDTAALAQLEDELHDLD